MFCIPLCSVNLYVLNHYSTLQGPYDDKAQIVTLAYSMKKVLHHVTSLNWVKIVVIESVVYRYCTVVIINRDNVEWTEEQEASAKKKVSENSQPLPSEKQGFDGFSTKTFNFINIMYCILFSFTFRFQMISIKRSMEINLDFGYSFFCLK